MLHSQCPTCYCNLDKNNYRKSYKSSYNKNYKINNAIYKPGIEHRYQSYEYLYSMPVLCFPNYSALANKD